jgi:hypothetical protein
MGIVNSLFDVPKNEIGAGFWHWLRFSDVSTNRIPRFRAYSFRLLPGGTLDHWGDLVVNLVEELGFQSENLSI